MGAAHRIRFRLWMTLAIVAAVLTACGGGAAATPSQASSASAATNAPSPASTASPSASPTVTPEPAPTPTPTPKVDLPDGGQQVDLPDGGQLPARTIASFPGKYGDFFTAYATASAGSDSSALAPLVTPAFLARLEPELAALRASRYTREMFGYATTPASLDTRSATPATNATSAKAVIPGSTELVIIDADGNNVNSKTYGEVEMIFARQANGAWLIDDLRFIPIPGPD